MRRSPFVLLALPSFLSVLAAAEPAAPSPAPAAKPVEEIRGQAKVLEPLAASDLARRFLRATAALPSIETRTVLRDKTTRQYYSAAEAAALSAEARQALETVELDEGFYYNTRYGSPLAY